MQQKVMVILKIIPEKVFFLQNNIAHSDKSSTVSEIPNPHKIYGILNKNKYALNFGPFVKKL